MGKFWILLRDPGSVNGAFPIVRELRMKNHQTLLFAEETAASILLEGRHPCRARQNFVHCQDPAALVDGSFDRPHVILTTIASNGGMPRDCVPLLRERFPSVPVVLMEEYYGGGFDLEWKDPDFRPSFVCCVNDDYSEQCILNAWPEYRRDHLIRTGYPALDKYYGVDTTQAAEKIRSTYSLDPSLPRVVFLGQDVGTSVAFSILVEALNHCDQPVILIPRMHPRMMRADKPEWPEEREKYDAAISRLASHVACIRDTAAFQTSEIIAGSTLVVAMDTTAFMEASALRIPSISIVTDEIRKLWAQVPTGRVEGRASVELGCTARAESQNELNALIIRAYADDLGLQENQERVYQINGKNAARTAEFLISLLP